MSQSPWLQCGEVIVYKEDLPRLLPELSLLQLFIRRLIEHQVSSKFVPSAEEQVAFQKDFIQRERITDEESLRHWLERSGLTEEEISQKLYSSLCLEQFKSFRFAQAAQNLFLENKGSYDRVIYSLIRVAHRAQATELHLRLEDEESTFSELAAIYSQGIERQSNGQLGPMELGMINPVLSERLRVSKQGQLWPPFQVDQWWVILRLERHLPAQYDSQMSKRLIDSLYETWMLEQVKAGMRSINSCVSSDITPTSAEIPPNTDQSIEPSDPDNFVSSILSRFRGKS